MVQRPIVAATVFNRLLTRTRLKQLQLVMLTAELGSTQSAAHELGMSQPAASKAISELEALLQTALFQRHARGMTPTAACLEILPLLRTAVRALNACAESLAQYGQGGQGMVRVGAVMSSIPGGLGPLLPLFFRQFPKIGVEIVEDILASLLSRYAEGGLDVILMRRPLQVPTDSHFTPLWNDRYHIIAGPEHPLSKVKRISLHRLLSESWALAPLGTRMRQTFDKILAQLGLPTPETNMVTASLTMFVSYLQNTSAIAIMPASVVIPFAERGLISILPVAIDQPIEEIGILARTKDLPWAAFQFVEFIKEHKSEVSLATVPLRSGAE